MLEGDLIISSPSDIEGLARYTEVTGRVLVGTAQSESPGIEQLEALSCLRTVGEELSIWMNPDLESLAGLERLESVGALSVSENPVLGSVEALNHLVEVSGYAYFDRNPMLAAISLDSLETAERLDIGSTCGVGNASLVELGLGSLAHFDFLLIGSNPALVKLSGLAGLADRIGADANPAWSYEVSVMNNPELPLANVLEALGPAEEAGAIMLFSHCGNGDQEPCECPPNQD